MSNAQLLFLPLLVFGVLLESSVTSMPLLFNILLVWFILSKDLPAGRQATGIFFLAFIFGMVLDTLLVQKVGISSLYSIVAIFIVVLYEKKFEIQTPAFVFLSSFLGSVGYLLITSQQYIMQQAILSALLSTVVFYRIYSLQKKENE